jgi:hypothetical protein
MESGKNVRTDSSSGKPHSFPSKEPITTASPTQDVDDINLEPAFEKPTENTGPADEPHSIYTTNQKRAIILAASIAAFFSPLSANIYLPALNTLAKDLSVSNTLITLTVTTYLVRNHFLTKLVEQMLGLLLNEVSWRGNSKILRCSRYFLLIGIIWDSDGRARSENNV